MRCHRFAAPVCDHACSTRSVLTTGGYLAVEATAAVVGFARIPVRAQRSAGELHYGLRLSRHRTVAEISDCVQLGVGGVGPV